MQRLLSGSLIVCALALALPAAAQVEHPPVPVDKAAYHWPVFSNEHVMVLRNVDGGNRHYVWLLLT
jgi:hypothetical protein